MTLALELVLYGAMVVVYLFLVVRFLGNWIVEVSRENLSIYAVLSLLLIVVQGLILESVTTALFRMANSKWRE